MNDFELDNEWQRDIRDRIIGPQFYGRFAAAGRYVYIDKGRLATTLQKQYAVDTILQGRGGAAYCIEEKIVRWPGYRYSAYCLETDSCTIAGRESPGWMRYARADFLLYAFVQDCGGVEVHLIDFPKLQAWFAANENDLPRFGPLATLNASTGRKAPISRVRNEVGLKTFSLEAELAQINGARAVARTAAIAEGVLPAGGGFGTGHLELPGSDPLALAARAVLT